MTKKYNSEHASALEEYNRLGGDSLARETLEDIGYQFPSEQIGKIALDSTLEHKPEFGFYPWSQQERTIASSGLYWSIENAIRGKSKLQSEVIIDSKKIKAQEARNTASRINQTFNEFESNNDGEISAGNIRRVEALLDIASRLVIHRNIFNEIFQKPDKKMPHYKTISQRAKNYRDTEILKLSDQDLVDLYLDCKADNLRRLNFWLRQLEDIQ